jgi:hypothetical protein
MNPSFEEVLSKMETLFQRFVGAPRVSFADRKNFPTAPGLYLLSEADKDLYVGRSSSGLKKRLRGHTAGTHFSSSFAFLLARDETNMKPTYKKEGSRPELMLHPVFRPAFDRAVERIRNMEVRFIELEDDHQQYLLELYTALQLKTPHNHFRTS